MKNTFHDNVFVREYFLLTVKKTSCIENIRLLEGLRKMLRLRQFECLIIDRTKLMLPLDLAPLKV